MRKNDERKAHSLFKFKAEKITMGLNEVGVKSYHQPICRN